MQSEGTQVKILGFWRYMYKVDYKAQICKAATSSLISYPLVESYLTRWLSLISYPWVESYLTRWLSLISYPLVETYILPVG